MRDRHLLSQNLKVNADDLEGERKRILDDEAPSTQFLRKSKVRCNHANMVINRQLRSWN